MAEFLQAVNLVLHNEGLLVDDKQDAGGITAYGISYRFYKSKLNPSATADDIKRLTREDAISIYKTYFWDKAPFVEIHSQKLCNKLFDLSVNCGLSHSVGFLQKGINDAFGQHLVIDGQLGAKTLHMANELDSTIVYAALVAQAEIYYRDIATRANNQKYLNGWLHRLVVC